MSMVRGSWRACGGGLVLAGRPGGWVGAAQGAKLADVRVVDDEHIQVHLLDGEVEWKDTGTGPTAFHGGCDSAGEVIHKFNPPLDTAAAVKAGNYTLSSAGDRNYQAGSNPTAAFRKSKVSGTDRDWPNCNCTIEHTIYLALPKKMQQGAKYTLKIAGGVNSDTAAKDFTFDVFSSVSEAIHVNLIGYNPEITAIKSADLYMWMGDGGARDYSGYVGKKVSLYNVATKTAQEVGAVSFWKKSGGDFGGRDLIKSDVWNCDFSAFTGTGTYRLAIEGVGCSPDFVLEQERLLRAVQDVGAGVLLHADRGGQGYQAGAAAAAVHSGEGPADVQGLQDHVRPVPSGLEEGRRRPVGQRRIGPSTTNRATRRTPTPGAGIRMRRIGTATRPHVSIIWDLLLPYILSGGKLSDDNCQIRESGNGIPDLLDEANYETDFWLRLRDGKGGYSCGINNPSQKDTVMYQAGASPYMAWASAANAAMTAEAFRIAGRPDLVKKYVAAATEAWKTANEEGLDLSHGIGNGEMRGRDLKFMAAAYLYNVTGEKSYEDAMAKECRINSPTAEIDTTKSNQLWGAAAYVLCAKNKAPADPLPQAGRGHEGGDHPRGDEEERGELAVVAEPAQQQQRLRVVPEHRRRCRRRAWPMRFRATARRRRRS